MGLEVSNEIAGKEDITSGENDVHAVLSSDLSPTHREADSSSSSSSSDNDCRQPETGEIHLGCSRLPSASMKDAPSVSSDLLSRDGEISQAGRPGKKRKDHPLCTDLA